MKAVRLARPDERAEALPRPHGARDGETEMDPRYLLNDLSARMRVIERLVSGMAGDLAVLTGEASRRL